MSDLRRAVLDANNGIVGIGPGPYLQPADMATMRYPTDGYDAELVKFDWEAGPPGSLAWSGYSREEWIWLADEMLRRWTEFRQAVERAP
jgi:hypothetical protein